MIRCGQTLDTPVNMVKNAHAISAKQVVDDMVASSEHKAIELGEDRLNTHPKGVVYVENHTSGIQYYTCGASCECNTKLEIFHHYWFSILKARNRGIFGLSNHWKWPWKHPCRPQPRRPRENATPSRPLFSTCKATGQPVSTTSAPASGTIMTDFKTGVTLSGAMTKQALSNQTLIHFASYMLSCNSLFHKLLRFSHISLTPSNQLDICGRKSI